MADSNTQTITYNGFNEAAVKAWNTGRAQDLFSWQSVSSALLALVGAYKQYQMYAQMGDLAQAQQKMIDQQKTLTLDAYNTMTKPQFTKASAYLWGYGNTWGKAIVEKVAACGTAYCEYREDGGVYNRVAVQTAAVVNKAKRTGLRTTRIGQVGVCCDNDFRFAALQAGLMVKAIGIAEQFEAQKKFQWTQFYWQRNVSAAQIAQNTISTGANLLVGAGTGIQNALNGMTALAGQAGQTAELGMKSLDKSAGFFGGMAALGGAGVGTLWGQAAGDRTALTGSMFSNAVPPSSSAVGLQGNLEFGSSGGTIGVPSLMGQWGVPSNG